VVQQPELGRTLYSALPGRRRDTAPVRRPDDRPSSADRPEAPILDVSYSSLDGTATITADGELDLATAPLLRARLDEASRDGRRVVADLRQVSFMDSTGLQVLMHAEDASREDGWTWTILASEAVMRVVELAALEERLPVRRPD
jgi:stage II sporulation protein AA (anti-sigma F factor antagonist)